MDSPIRLTAEQLYHECNPDLLPFKTTETLENFTGIYGQERAKEAINFGIGVRRPDYNMFVMGHPQSGRFSFVMDTLKGQAKQSRKPHDWCYLNNLTDNRYPIALEFNAGKGEALKTDLKYMFEAIVSELPSAFENPAYQRQRSKIDREFNRQYDKALEQVENEARPRSIALYRDAGSVGFTPVADGQILDEGAFSQLDEETRNKINHNISELEDFLNESLTRLPLWRREMNEKLKRLETDTAKQAIQPLLQPVREKYASHSKLVSYLGELENQLVKTAIELASDDKLNELKADVGRANVLERNFGVNLVVSHQKTKGAPVVFESHPTYENLFGRVEYTSEMGAMMTNYQLIRSGALHRANGGYLVIEAEKLFEQPLVWSALKRSLKSEELRIENPFAEMAGVSTITLNPEPIPLNIKVIIIGDRDIYYLLQQMDAEFTRLFRVVVDFDEEVPRTDASIRGYARLMKTLAVKENCAHLTRQAVARLIEHGSRMAENQEFISSQIGEVVDLICEADFKRHLTGESVIQDFHVEQALEAKQQRTNRVSNRMQDDIIDGIVLINTDGEKVGQCNGLTVMQLGDVSFGSPARITATVHPGTGGIVDIEREVTLGQPIHSKGVLILSGYLGHQYAQDFRLAISASIAMEQSYGYVDGDSASLAEICALISALTHTPIKQSFALTGSINQYGEVQAIGGVNEKIEGFFDICEAKGLTGDQGVIIPQANSRNLMLKKEVVEAVECGMFSIYTVASVDDTLAILTGKKAGKRKADGKFTQRSLNAHVVKRLQELSKMGD